MMLLLDSVWFVSCILKFEVNKFWNFVDRIVDAGFWINIIIYFFVAALHACDVIEGHVFPPFKGGGVEAKGLIELMLYALRNAMCGLKIQDGSSSKIVSKLRKAEKKLLAAVEEMERTYRPSKDLDKLLKKCLRLARNSAESLQSNLTTISIPTDEIPRYSMPSDNHFSLGQNGMSIPMVGFGTWGTAHATEALEWSSLDTEHAVLSALEEGSVLILIIWFLYYRDIFRKCKEILVLFLL